MALGPEQRAADLDQAWSALMAAAQAGDRTAYGRLLRETTPFIRRIARQNRVAPDAVDDVIQDVLLTVHRARQTYDPSRSFSAWLAAIAKRRAIDVLRSAGRRSRRELHEPVAYEAHADPQAHLDEDGTPDMRVASVKAAVETLPPGQREAIEILALRQLSLDEAARLTGRTKGALKVNMHRALVTLRARFGGGIE